MRKTALFLVSILILSGASFGQDLKIGVVNSELVMQTYPEFRRAEEQLNREVAGWQTDRAGWEAKMEALQEDISEREGKLQAGQTTFSEKRKRELQAQIDSMKVSYQQQFQAQMSAEQERFNKRRMELLSEVLEVVNGTIKELGEEQGYDLVLDGSNGTIVYAKNPDDITDELLRRLQDK
ncbi:MAG TPA: OmpH family outer membrane protein [Bacteroidetes bacterium]|nr:OmpH family outer membrane protein [Bacteroidota bacterium]